MIVITIPSIANFAVTAKADVYGSMCIFFAFICIIEMLRKKDLGFAGDGFIGLLLATGGRISSYVWIFLTGILLIVTTLLCKIKFKYSVRITRPSVIEYLFGIVFILGIHLRTFYLTGYLLYPSFKPIQQLFGFHARYPFTNIERDITNGISPDISVIGITKKLYMIFFDPADLEHVIMAWTSTAVLLLLLLLILFRSYNIKKYMFKRLMICTITVYLFTFLVLYSVVLGNPDGNYFDAALIILISSMVYVLSQASDFAVFSQGRLFKLGIYLIILSQFIISAVSHPSWSWGTDRFSTELIADNFSTDDMNNSEFIYDGIESVAAYVKSNLEKKRVISVGAPNESITYNGNIMDSYDSFCQYFDSIDLSGVIVFKDYEGMDRDYCEQYIKERNMRLAVTDDSAELWIY